MGWLKRGIFFVIIISAFGFSPHQTQAQSSCATVGNNCTQTADCNDGSTSCSFYATCDTSTNKCVSSAPTPRPTKAPTIAPTTPATVTPTDTPVPPACVTEGNFYEEQQTGVKCCKGLTDTIENTTATSPRHYCIDASKHPSPAISTSPATQAVNTDFTVRVTGCIAPMHVYCEGPADSIPHSFTDQKTCAKEVKRIDNTTVDALFNFGSAGTFAFQAQCDTGYSNNIFADSADIKITNAEENKKIMCSACDPESDYKYYNQTRGVCCTNSECSPSTENAQKITKIIEDAKKAGVAPVIDASLLAGIAASPISEECSDGQVCTPGRGCNFTNPDPGVPPCIEGVDKDNKVISIDRSNFDVNGKIKDDEAVRKKVKELQSSITRCTKVFTSVGVFNTDPAGFVSSILGVLLSISGMLAVLLIIRSGYQMMTSQGNPEAIQEARDRITSAIIGLLFIIFSLVVLQVIGVDILKIPGFGN